MNMWCAYARACWAQTERPRVQGGTRGRSTSANRASRNCRRKCRVLRGLWCLGGDARSVGAQGPN